MLNLFIFLPSETAPHSHPPAPKSPDAKQTTHTRQCQIAATLDRPSEWTKDKLNVGQQSSRWANHTVYSAPKVSKEACKQRNTCAGLEIRIKTKQRAGRAMWAMLEDHRPPPKAKKSWPVSAIAWSCPSTLRLYVCIYHTWYIKINHVRNVQ